MTDKNGSQRRNEKLLTTLAAANILIATQGLSKTQQFGDDGLDTITAAQIDSIEVNPEHNGGCGNRGCNNGGCGGGGGGQHFA